MSAILVKSYAGQAESYFEKELGNTRESYYSEEEIQIGQWTGIGAEILGLSGEIKQEDFSKLSNGINPKTDERFRRQVLTRTREVDGKVTAVKGIAGWDMVISAPKSVSIVALIGKDSRVRAVHNEAVSVALDKAERQAQANNGGGRKEQTDNLVIGRFSHDSARPSRSGFVAPQLHDHCFIMNVTQRKDGVLKPLESLELHRSQYYIKSVYYAELADRLQNLGYSIEIDKETEAPEIVGISKKYREACSQRRADILALAKEAGKNYRQLGLVNRREKIFDQDLIREQHAGIDGLFDFQAKRLVESVKGNPNPVKDDSEKAKEAKASVSFALAKVSKRDAVFEPRRILLEANRRGIGKTNVTAIEDELENYKNDEKVKIVQLRDGRDVAYLSSDEKVEDELPDHIKIVQPKQTLEAEVSAEGFSDNASEFVHKEFLDLSAEQQTAVKEIIKAKAGVTTLEGRAGVEKTRTLSIVREIAKNANYEVVGLAPTNGAAQELEKIDIESVSLQKVLASKNEQREQKKFFIVDESSFVSSRQMDKFLREAVKENDRVLFVGDTRQNVGVEAGKPFARIQRDQLTSGTKIETIRRQTKKSDRETVKKLSEENIRKAIEEMNERGQIVEIKDRDDRHQAIVEAFTAEPDKTIVIAPRNTDRQEINSKIHTALIDAGQIKSQETEISILRPRNELTGVERESAGAYQEGDIISYRRGSKVNEIPAKSLAKVVKTDRDQNLLTVELGRGEDKKQITYDPKRLRGVSVFQEDQIKISEGDRLQFRTPFEAKRTKIANGTVGEVKKITSKEITLITGKNTTVKLDTNEPHAIDYGYAIKSHSSRGKTIERVLIHADTNESKNILNEKMAYVAISRGRDEIKIYTDNAEKLPGKLARNVEKSEISQIKAETIEQVPQIVTEKVEEIPQEIKAEPIPQIDEIQTKPEIEKTESRSEAVEDQEKAQIEELTESTVSVNAVSENKEEPKTAKIDTQAPPVDVAETEPPKDQRDLILDILQIVRDNLDKQDILPEPQTWKNFADYVINEMPDKQANVSHERLLTFLQEDLPESEKIDISGKTELKAIHAILTTASETQRDQLIENAFADGVEKPSITKVEFIEVKESIVKDTTKSTPKIETENLVTAKDLFSESADKEKPQISTTVNISEKGIAPAQKTRDFAGIDHEKIEKVITATNDFAKARELFANNTTSQTPKVRDFEKLDREDLIKELVAVLRDESQNMKETSFEYKHERRLTKYYRLLVNREPTERQLDKISSINERLNEPLPAPKNYIEANILMLDNMTEEKKTTSHHKRINGVIEIVEREVSEKTETFENYGNSVQDDPFGRKDIYFIEEMYQQKASSPEGKSYYEFMREMEERGFINPQKDSRLLTPEQIQQDFFQLGIANALQEQMKTSLDEQGIKLKPLEQRIINKTIDGWGTKPPTDFEINKVQEFSQISGSEITPETKLEAQAYLSNQMEDREFDERSSSLASKASERAKEIELAKEEIERERQAELEREAEMEMDDDRDYGYEM